MLKKSSIKRLIELADKLDQKGFKKEAEEVDKIYEDDWVPARIDPQNIYVWYHRRGSDAYGPFANPVLADSVVEFANDMEMGMKTISLDEIQKRGLKVDKSRVIEEFVANTFLETMQDKVETIEEWNNELDLLEEKYGIGGAYQNYFYKLVSRLGKAKGLW